MKHVVITGSTRGIGYGLAREFLRTGCRVMINGQSQESVDTALQSLREMYPDMVEGYAAAVHNRDELEQLWNYAEKQFGTIDIWINNAGIDQERKYFWELDEEANDKVVHTYLKGMMNGCHVAFHHMLKQGCGQIFNIEGFGSNGMMREKMTLYGTSKSAVSYFTRSLAIEAKQTNIKVGTLSPGMVATEFLRNSLDEQNRKIFNILGAMVEPVKKFLAKKVLENQKNIAKFNG
ncbi:SDR family oxidoreductase [Bacillus sp. UNC41MFS5]|uniref:SDR family oxidoreductase n=1 Tax=Bacillus sp. UNC41MFS5 TaxID=1449046 RepID=UPI00069186D8|nr:SDR family oxidoreductase [Bacillus sp. UNC41MFS5]